MIRVLFFGPVADRMQMREIQIEFVTAMTLQDVVEGLSARCPQAFDIVSFMAVNQAQVSNKQQPLADGDEIAFMAKFSGG